MRLLQALHVSDRVFAWLEQRPEGRVHSLFDRACNLDWGDDLITLAQPAYGMMPGGIAVAPAGGERWNFLPGEPVRWEAALQRLVGVSATVDLSGAARWANRPPAPGVAPGPVVADRAAAAAAVVRTHGRGEMAGVAGLAGLEPPDASGDPLLRWSTHARGPLQALLRAAATGDVTAADPALRSLIGLGEGLTPSCDDFVLGLLAVLHFGGCGLSGPQAAWGRWLGEQAAALAEKGTTPVSRNYLRLAAGGGFGERLEAVTLALLAPEPDCDVASTALKLIQHGHSSGTDSLVGVIFGATAIFLHDQGRRTVL
jgi:hypothetical protein